MHPKVAIILLNWNSFDHSSNCIESLQLCDYPNFEIIVVDNGSIDGSGNLLKAKFPKIILIASPTNEGFAAGNNRGFSYAIENQFAYAMMLNNDVFVEPDFISNTWSRILMPVPYSLKFSLITIEKKYGMGDLIFYLGWDGPTQKDT
jgi:GT2 family glycosyltransferase